MYFGSGRHDGQPRSLFFVLLFLLGAGLLSSPAQGQTFADPRFGAETVVTLPAFTPVGVTFAPDGRMFIWQKNGIVRIYKDGALLGQPFIDISSKVNNFHDRGLLGFALDPDFATNGYAYLFYTYEDGSTPNNGAKTAQLIRVTADPANPDVALPSSEVVLLGSITTPPCSSHPAGSDCIPADAISHTVGMIRFLADGTLLLSNGDGADFNVVDALALRAQDLNSYAGKILRIRPDGTAPSDNPFYDGTNSIRSKVYAYGLRNPYRFFVDLATGRAYYGDVGWNSWEEVNTGRGVNFGWPCYEGNSQQPQYQSAFAQCRNLPASAVTNPFYTYSHAEGATIIVGPVYTATAYPSPYQRNLFIADFTNQWIRRIVLDAAGNLVSVAEFATGVGGIVHMELGPDGMLYYVDILSGAVRRIRFNGPVARATATPQFGYSPLTVNFSSAGTLNPSGGTLSYHWDFGDGTTSTEPNPTHIYISSTVRQFPVVLTVTDSEGVVSRASLTVTVGSLPPTATITVPADNTVVFPGTIVTFSGSATDPDEGTLPSSALSWQVLLHHNEHVHPVLSLTGSSGSFTAESHGPGTYSYEIILTARDSSGLTDTKRVHLPLVEAIYRINAGGPSYTDTQGRQWSADQRFNTGNTASVTNPIAGTNDDVLFQSERWDPPAAPELAYSLPVTNGSYRVNLYFAEIYNGCFSVGCRVFDVLIESQLVLDNLDIFREVGSLAALLKTFNVTVSDGVLNIEFRHVVENPKISAIEVLALSTTTNQPPTAVAGATPTSGVAPLTVSFTSSGSADPDGTIVSYNWDFGDGTTSTLANPSHTYTAAGDYTARLTVTDNGGATATATISIRVSAGGGGTETAVYRINAGGPSYTDTQGRQWSADQRFNTGNTASVTNPIAGTNDDVLFQSERWDPPAAPELAYSLPVTNGSYRVNLYFAEIYNECFSVGCRVFDVLIEGQLVLDNLDIFREVGSLAALVKTFDVTVSDGVLNIEFRHVVENPKISAIEVLALSTTTNQPPTAVAGATPTSGVAPLTVSFTSSGSADPDGTIVSYSWNFGDGTTSTEANPSHVYATPGLYTVTLTITDDKGATDNATLYIAVHTSEVVTDVSVCPWKGCKKGAASFSVDDSVSSCRAELEAAGFRGTYYLTGNSFSSFWTDYANAGHELGGHTVTHPCPQVCNFPDINNCSFTDADVEFWRVNEFEPNLHAIQQVSGRPVVTMAWTCGCCDIIRKTAAANYHIASRGYFDSTCNLSWVQGLEDETPQDFLNLRSFNSFTQGAIDSAIQQGKWANIVSHGSCDGISYMGSKKDELYLAPVGEVVKYIQIRNNTEFMNYSRTEDRIRFSAFHLVPPFVPRSLIYTFLPIPFDDPVTLRATLNPTDIVLAVRVNGVSVPFEVKTLDGQRYVLFDTALHVRKDIEIQLVPPGTNVPPTAVAGASPTSGTVPLTVNFSSAGSSDIDGTIVSYNWDFGDGTTSTLANPSHTYTAAGDYTARLTVTDNGGATATATVSIRVTAPPSEIGAVVYRINAGGPSYTDTQGRQWSADQRFNTGNTASVTNPIAGTNDDVLFQSERWDPPAAPELAYSLPVTNGSYRVNLYFAEIYNGCFSVGCRVFDVLIEGQLVLDNLDIFREVGSLAALVKTFDVTVSDGVLNIEFRHVVENPKISAIEVLELVPPTTDPQKFSFVILPDTQFYTQSFPHIFDAQTRWIVNNRFARNIAFVMHEGDVTDTNSSTAWQEASESMQLLDGLVPYSILPGNHDMGIGGAADTRDTTLFNTFFPVSRFSSYPWFGGTYEPGKMDNSFFRFTAGGQKWLVLSLEFGPREEVLQWANQVVAAHPDHLVAVVSHTHVYFDGTLHGSNPSHLWNPHSYGIASQPGGVNDGQEVWDKLIRLHPNIRFVFNGHVLNNNAMLIGTGDHGNPVYQMLANYQYMENGGNGYLRILEFDTVARTVSVTTYSPWLDTFLTDPANQFTLTDVEMTLPPMPDTAAPLVSITSPTNGASVRGTITLSASATDNVGVAGVQFRVDGANHGSEDVSAPYSIQLDTSTLTPGNHTISAVARDAAGNTATASVVITVLEPLVETVVYRINAGGPSYTDTQGRQWSADQRFNTGNTASVTNPIAGTNDDVLFQSERWDPPAAPELAYSLPVTNGSYRVNLYFAEIYNGCFSVGCRVFDVLIEGVLVLNDLDIFREVGSLTALVKTFDVTVSDGVLNIEFRHVVENPKISAIEVIALNNP